MLIGKPAHGRHGVQPARTVPWSGPPPGLDEVRLAALGYLGAIVLGPVVPLSVYILRRRTSRFVHWHAAQALNVTLTCLIYLLCCAIVFGLLALDKLSTALIVVVPVIVIGWAVVAVRLVRAASAASRGETVPMASWACTPFVK